MIELIIIIAIVGVILWFVHAYVPMHPAFKMAINIIAVIGLILYVLEFFGITDWNWHHHRRGEVPAETQVRT